MIKNIKNYIINIKDLSKDIFETLKSTGLLKKLYPDAPDNFEGITGKHPIPKKYIDWTHHLRFLENVLDGDSWYDFTNQFDF